MMRALLVSQIIKFDKIITNVWGGYIGDNGNADYSKFIAPQNGTYQFNANLYNEDNLIGTDLEKNSMFIIGTSNGNLQVWAPSWIWWKGMQCTCSHLAGWQLVLGIADISPVSLVFSSVLTTEDSTYDRTGLTTGPDIDEQTYRSNRIKLLFLFFSQESDNYNWTN